ncbi:MAG: diphosphate--fructose-6-phosphate 1-phosphotransferase [Anaerococcus sp.]|uniref:diphosphate--fructose-6-phosphate 1-phosphotransferase n=1 Tax=Anaerococcus sp. TaxID=1872515 RepID=UPI002637435B|nr:diphosphate--fructose-6-phosphate 1-phosphotransferase [Anaerococcus sp.]MCI5971512.1 diphosphate--fructose-6-phosphate 1-phosphotransferase [Anaerococcus sp.]MDD6919095.1 diphosphate--fructose-6-phosphate 1-phosphotransferase [Peptoniphilaceae bacterium]MDY2927447.1 diphosphate--fructose-6-phosphate 1-phosphotransferase [Anaerococcus sp.]
MNYLIVHGGGPTPVINASLYGLVTRLKKEDKDAHIYGALGGIEAIYNKRYIDFAKVNKFELENLLYTPASAIGSSRYPLYNEDYEKISKKLKEQHIDTIFLNGGNGTMNTCAKLAEYCKGYDINVIGIPKTMDNDIANIDHSPGFGSCGKFIASSVAEICVDVKSLPIHVCIVETMGRNAGWLAGASALAKSQFCNGPDLIYTPEHAFDEKSFLEKIRQLWSKKRGIVVVVSEGLVGLDKEPIVKPIFKSGRSVYYGDVSSYLAESVIKKLGIKARSEKPGLIGRSNISIRSDVDLKEAIIVGEKAATASLNNQTGVMVGIVRESVTDYKISYPIIPINPGMLAEKKMPIEFINEEGNGVTDAYLSWCRPIVDYSPYPYVSYNI